MRIDIDRLSGELESLARFSEDRGPGVTRIVYSPPDGDARQWLRAKIAAEQLAIREDSVGNLFARWPGSDPLLPPVATGSHVDAIPNSGIYDGTVGVLGALEGIRALRTARFRPRRSIELILFTSEEPTRFGIGCLGSRLLSGTLSAEAAGHLRSKEGKTLDELRFAAGFSGPVETVRLQPGHYSAFLELHIEQGKLLERESIPLGVVTHIAAPASLRIVIEGEGGHAGAVLMRQRRDALTAAAEIVLKVEASALQTGVDDTVATTGICEVFPGAVNSVPSSTRLEIDVRDIDERRRDFVLREITSFADDLSLRRRVRVATEILNADSPAACHPRLVQTLATACGEAGLSHRLMVSRAYHDSLFMARIAPTAMLFIPCRDGVSHRPDEYASPAAISNGVTVLASALARLASE